MSTPQPRTLDPARGLGEPRDITPYEPAVAYPAASPLRFDVRYQERYRRALPLVKWLLLAPSAVALLFAQLGAAAAWIASAVAVVATGRYPRGLFDYMTGVARWQLRYAAYLYLLTDAYPPFALYDQPTHPVRVEIDFPPEGRVARWRPLLAWLVVLPQALVLLLLYAGVSLLVLVAFVSIVFTGTFPRSAFDMIVRTLRFHGRVNAYAFFLTERHPGFAI